MNLSLSSKSDSMSTTLKKVLDEFTLLNETTHEHYAVILIKVMINLITNSKEMTMQGLTHEIKTAGEYLINHAQAGHGRSELVLRSTQTIYQHYISKGLQHSKADSMEALKSSLIEISQELIDIINRSKDNIKTQCLKFFNNRFKVLVVGYSNVVIYSLIEAFKAGIVMQIYIPECRPKSEGIETYRQLTEIGYPCKLIFDSAIGQVMENIDMVLTGAEAVVENGGIINRVGTYTTAICAKFQKKPFYVLAESFKFTRLFPLSQKDLSDSIRYSQEEPQFSEKLKLPENLDLINPLCDYTPPDLITLLFTDVGVFTPSAVSEELIQIFHT
ncbi:unnamed protein product [Paramecium octaurelia]|uniref:EIF-2B GDP-GTP exchange factor subunit alpha n=1 Tax=Paramecium octaurelia TaxID=43137 RepID=A0A8S1TEJ5_PAROT|nr:unnamed protein product [Paramecium octaurelia]